MWINEDILKKLQPAIEAVRSYHRHEVVGMQKIPAEGSALLVCNHSLATYDISLLMSAIYNDTGRIGRSLIDRLFYKIPFLGETMELLGSVKGTQENAEQLLNDGHLVTVAPGGMNESIRSSANRYQIRWEGRRGFIRLAIKTGSPLILAACPKADDIFEIYANPATKWVYETLKVPIVLARGIGPTPVPKPVKLVHFLSDPIIPPEMAPTKAAFERQVTRLHKQAIKTMEKLMTEGVQYRSDS
jgi:1-acyl-sn-glycerol-3-phosphate acyltransferase